MTGLHRDTKKLAIATELGADAVIDVEIDDVRTVISDITHGKGARVVVDTTPRAPRSVTDAIEIASQGGIIVLAGLKGNRYVPEMLSDRIITKELTVKGVLGVDYDSLEQACELIESEAHPLAQMHTHTFKIEDAEDALRTLAGDREGEDAIHMTIQPS